MELTSYPTIRKLLHWLIGLMAIGMFATGIVMTELAWSGPERELKNLLYSAHKWSGLLLLALMAVRVLVSLLWRGPELPGHVSAAEKLTARIVHTTLYALLLAVPILGWAGISAGGFLEPPLFGSVPMPALLERMDPSVSEFLFDMHEIAALALAALASLHILAALSHLIRADGVFRRMWF